MIVEIRSIWVLESIAVPLLVLVNQLVELLEVQALVAVCFVVYVDRMQHLQQLVDARGLELPDRFIQLVADDEYINRIRHNTIWLMIPEVVVPFPNSPDCYLANVFYEGQGCGFWHLLLAPDRSHIVAYSDDPLGLQYDFVPGFKPDLTTYTFYECAPTFDEWLAYYFLDCTAGDKHYAEMLEKYPNM